MRGSAGHHQLSAGFLVGDRWQYSRLSASAQPPLQSPAPMNAGYEDSEPGSSAPQLPQTWVNYYGAAPLADFEEAEDVADEDFYATTESASWEQPFPPMPPLQQTYSTAKLSGN